MLENDVSVPLAKLVLLFASLFAAGCLLTLPLYKWKIDLLVRSAIFIKILLWIPIFLVFVISLYLSNAGRLVIVVLLIVMALRDFMRNRRRLKLPRSAYVYLLLFTSALLHFYFLGNAFPELIVRLLIIICFASVLSDVCAFFMGSYLGRHHLPVILNKRKSWEGVGGQVLGALLGVLLVNWFILPVPSLFIFLPIGIGSAIGDLTNSYVKRQMAIKDWGNSIPGHGGYLDRLSSLSFATALTFYWTLLFL